MEITLLTFVVVGGLVRISGLVRLHPSDLRIAHAPELAVHALDGPPLIAIATHVRPNGSLTWVAWDFARPDAVLVAYEARVERLDLAVGGRSEVIGHGPWVFNFQLPGRRIAGRHAKVIATTLRRLDA